MSLLLKIKNKDLIINNSSGVMPTILSVDFDIINVKERTIRKESVTREQMTEEVDTLLLRLPNVGNGQREFLKTVNLHLDGETPISMELLYDRFLRPDERDKDTETRCFIAVQTLERQQLNIADFCATTVYFAYAALELKNFHYIEKAMAALSEALTMVESLEAKGGVRVNRENLMLSLRVVKLHISFFLNDRASIDAELSTIYKTWLSDIVQEGKVNGSMVYNLIKVLNLAGFFYTKVGKTDVALNYLSRAVPLFHHGTGFFAENSQNLVEYSILSEAHKDSVVSLVYAKFIREGSIEINGFLTGFLDGISKNGVDYYLLTRSFRIRDGLNEFCTDILSKFEK